MRSWEKTLNFYPMPDALLLPSFLFPHSRRAQALWAGGRIHTSEFLKPSTFYLLPSTFYPQSCAVVPFPDTRHPLYRLTRPFSAPAAPLFLCVAVSSIDTRDTNEDNISSSVYEPRTTVRDICESCVPQHR